MESLVFVVLFSVVVMAWMSQGSHSLVFVREVSNQRVLISEGLVPVYVLRRALNQYRPRSLPSDPGMFAFEVTEPLIRVEADHSST